VIRAAATLVEAEILEAIGMYTWGNELWPTPIPRP
jgi:hypothetical protein